MDREFFQILISINRHSKLVFKLKFKIYIYSYLVEKLIPESSCIVNEYVCTAK